MRKTTGANVSSLPRFPKGAEHVHRPAIVVERIPPRKTVTETLNLLSEVEHPAREQAEQRLAKAVADFGGARAGSTIRRAHIVSADPVIAKRIERHVIQSTVAPAAKAKLIDHLARYLPEVALAALDQTQTSMRLLASNDETNTPSPRLIKEVGSGAALLTSLQMTAVRAMGYFSMIRNEVTVADSDPTTAPSTVVHELMHAIDFSLMKGGRMPSDSEAWSSLFDDAR